MPGLIFNTQTGRFASPMVDVANPVNWQHPLNIGRIAWYKCIANPGWRGGSILHDLVRGPGHTPNDGVLTGTPKPTWHGSQGLVGSDGSLTFNGSNTVVTSNATVADNLPSMTVSCWINKTGNGEGPIFISKMDNAGTGAGWFLTSYGPPGSTIQPIFAIQAAGGNQYYLFYTTATFTNNKWYHVVAMYTGAVNGIIIYVNGIKQSLTNYTSTGTVTSYSTTDSIIIGNTTSSSVSYGYNPFIGSIDDVSIWNRTLSAQEIADIYNLSRQGYPGVINYFSPVEYSFPTLSSGSVGTATGTSSAVSFTISTGTATGTSSGNSVSPIANVIGTITGTSKATGTGSWRNIGINTKGTARATSTASGFTNQGVGTASGTSTASGITTQIIQSITTIQGTSTTFGFTNQGVGTALGISTASGFTNQGVGSAIGTSTASGVGASITAGTWTFLNNPVPSTTVVFETIQGLTGPFTIGADCPILLTDGTVLVPFIANLNGQEPGNWFKLTPDSTGSYQNGTWSTIANSHWARLSAPSGILPNGKAWIIGGESCTKEAAAGTVASGQQESNSGEIYDPVAGSWSDITPQPAGAGDVGDSPAVVLTTGLLMMGDFYSHPYLYNPATNTWSSAAGKTHESGTEETCLILLPDNSILSWDILKSNSADAGYCERYNVGSNTWSDAGTLPLSFQLQDAGEELGPFLLLYNGWAWCVGATGVTAFYSYNTNSWVVGPSLPNGHKNQDIPGSVLPNGNVLILTEYGTPEYASPINVYEFNPNTNIYLDVTPPVGMIIQDIVVGFMYSILLPTGQVLITQDSQINPILYTPVGTPNNSWLPTVTGIVANADGSYTLTGTQFTGLTEGSYYGDDNSMSTNYPIVKLVDSNNVVWFGRSSGWSPGICSGNTPVTTNVTFPTGFSIPGSTLYVVTNGISSAPFALSMYLQQSTGTATGTSSAVSFTISTGTATGTSSAVSFSPSILSSISTSPLILLRTVNSNLINPANPINWQHPLNIGRIAWYKCIANPGWRGGSILHDLVRGPGHTPNDGVLTGTPKPTWHGSQGLVGSDGSLSFNGSNTVVTGNNKVADNLPAMTVSCWIKYTSLISGIGANFIVTKIANDNGNGWGFYIANTTGSGLIYGCLGFLTQSNNGSDYNECDGTVPLPINKWIYVSAAYSGGAAGLIKLYVNGKFYTSGNDGPGLVTSTSSTTPVIIGSDASPIAPESFIGSIDDVSIWNRALSAQEIADIYNLSRQGYPGVINYFSPVEYSFPTLSSGSVGTATGTSSAVSFTISTGTATGTSSGNSVSPIANVIGTITGTSKATGTGSWRNIGINTKGTARATSTASGFTNQGVGTASGTSTASGITTQIIQSITTIQGTSTTFGFTNQGVGTALGISTASGFTNQGVGSAIGTSTASGVGASITAGTWTYLNNPVPSTTAVFETVQGVTGPFTIGADCPILLSDGTVLVPFIANFYGQEPGNWFKLTPDSTGSYQNGTWSTIPNSHWVRCSAPSGILPSGKAWIIGGENCTKEVAAGTIAISGQQESNTGEIYDPVAGSWSDITPHPAGDGDVGDSPSVVLTSGLIMTGDQNSHPYLYNPTTNTWSSAAGKTHEAGTVETSLTLLPDNSILSWDILKSNSADAGYCERYNVGSNTWSDAGTLPLSFQLQDADEELGPFLLLYDGRAWCAGATGVTAFYNYTGNSWVVGPSLPNGYKNQDIPGSVLPNGNVLIFVAHGTPEYAPPGKVYEFNPNTNVYLDVSPPVGMVVQDTVFALVYSILLPTGQVLITQDSQINPILYTPVGTPNNSWLPTVTGIVANADGSYTLTGTQFTGLTEGSYYGDDNSMSTNYPIVKLVDSNNVVWFGRTYGWSPGVCSGNTPVTTNVTFPSGFSIPGSTLYVVTNGISSAPFALSMYLQQSTGTATGTSTAIANSTAGIALDATSNTGYQSNVSSLSWNHTWNGSNRFLSIDISILSAVTVTSMSYGGATCTLIGAQNIIGGTGRVECWRICQNDSGAPAVGTNTISVTLSGTTDCAGTAVSYTNVNQSGPTEAFNSDSQINSGYPTNAAVNITTITDNDWVHAALVTNQMSGITSLQNSRNVVSGVSGTGADADVGPVNP